MARRNTTADIIPVRSKTTQPDVLKATMLHGWEQLAAGGVARVDETVSLPLSFPDLAIPPRWTATRPPTSVRADASQLHPQTPLPQHPPLPSGPDPTAKAPAIVPLPVPPVVVAVAVTAAAKKSGEKSHALIKKGAKLHMEQNEAPVRELINKPRSLVFRRHQQQSPTSLTRKMGCHPEEAAEQAAAVVMHAMLRVLAKGNHKLQTAFDLLGSKPLTKAKSAAKSAKVGLPNWLHFTSHVRRLDAAHHLTRVWQKSHLPAACATVDSLRAIGQLNIAHAHILRACTHRYDQPHIEPGSALYYAAHVRSVDRVPVAVLATCAPSLYLTQAAVVVGLSKSTATPPPPPPPSGAGEEEVLATGEIAPPPPSSTETTKPKKKKKKRKAPDGEATSDKGPSKKRRRLAAADNHPMGGILEPVPTMGVRYPLPVDVGPGYALVRTPMLAALVRVALSLTVNNTGEHLAKLTEIGLVPPRFQPDGGFADTIQRLLVAITDEQRGVTGAWTTATSGYLLQLRTPGCRPQEADYGAAVALVGLFGVRYEGTPKSVTDPIVRNALLGPSREQLDAQRAATIPYIAGASIFAQSDEPAVAAAGDAMDIDEPPVPTAPPPPLGALVQLPLCHVGNLRVLYRCHFGVKPGYWAAEAKLIALRPRPWVREAFNMDTPVSDAEAVKFGTKFYRTFLPMQSPAEKPDRPLSFWLYFACLVVCCFDPQLVHGPRNGNILDFMKFPRY